jgi:hypothetical protein
MRGWGGGIPSNGSSFGASYEDVPTSVYGTITNNVNMLTGNVQTTDVFT